MVLTGMHVPIIRSFAMACLLTIAILADRRPVSSRGLALAATVLMLLSPQYVPNVSFQMSFSAVLALIAGYEALRPWLRRLHGTQLGAAVRVALVALALTSALAGSASAPYGAYHFGHVQVYFRACEHDRRAVDGAVGDAGRTDRAGADAAPSGGVGVGADGLGRDRLVVGVARSTAALPDAIIMCRIFRPGDFAYSPSGSAWLGLWHAAAAFGRGGDADRTGLAGAGSSSPTCWSRTTGG